VKENMGGWVMEGGGGGERERAAGRCESDFTQHESSYLFRVGQVGYYKC
jgi:hypothetical protein